MKICVPHIMYKRPKVYHAFAVGLLQLMYSWPQYDWTVIGVGSEGLKSRDLVQRYGFNYFEYPNDSITDKAQVRLELAKLTGADYYLFLGSDDVMTPDLFTVYDEGIINKCDWIAPYDIYYVHSAGKDFYYSSGYPDDSNRKGETMAVGRMVHKRCFDYLDWRVWGAGARDRSLDRIAFEKLSGVSEKPYFFWQKESKGYLFDIKSDFSLSSNPPYDRFEHLGHWDEFIKNEKLCTAIRQIYT